MKKIVNITLAITLIIALSNCKKKEEEKPIDPDLDVLEIKDEGAMVIPLSFVPLADNKFSMLTHNMDKNSFISVDIIDFVFGDKKEILNRYQLIKPDLMTSPRTFITNSNDKQGYYGLMRDGSSSFEFGVMFSKKENSDLVKHHYNINNGVNSVNYLTICEVTDGFVLTAPIKGYKKSGVYIEKFDKSFNSLWIKQHYENVDSFFYNTPATSFNLPNGEIIIFSNITKTSFLSKPSPDLRFLKVSENGDSLFSKTYNFKDVNWHIESGVMKNGNLYIIASNSALIHRLFCFDIMGNILWQKDFDEDVRIDNMRASENGIAFIGYVERNSNNNFFTRFFVTELDVSGNKIWEETNGADNIHHYGRDIYIDGNYYYAIIGQYTDNVAQAKTLIIKDKIPN